MLTILKYIKCNERDLVGISLFKYSPPYIARCYPSVCCRVRGTDCCLAGDLARSQAPKVRAVCIFRAKLLAKEEIDSFKQNFKTLGTVLLTNRYPPTTVLTVLSAPHFNNR